MSWYFSDEVIFRRRAQIKNSRTTAAALTRTADLRAECGFGGEVGASTGAV